MRRAIFLGMSIALACAGCSGSSPPAPTPPPPQVTVSYPIEREVTEYSVYTGRTAAVRSVTIIPRVAGYLVRIPFKEGAEVKKGDLLFEIDPRPYQALVD